MNWPTADDGSQTTPQLAQAALDAFRALEQRVRPDFRKTIVFTVIALAALVVGSELGGVHAHSINVRLATYAMAAVLAVAGVAATRNAAREIRRITELRAGPSAATPLRLTVLLGGYLFVAIAVCELCGVDLRQILVGGAITGIVLGLAAQPVLSNLFAGVVLLFARPYVPGQRVRVYSGAINGPHDGVVISAGILYTILQTADGPLNIPNSTLLSAAVGPPKTEGAGSRAGGDQPVGGGAAAGGSPGAQYVPPADQDPATTAIVIAAAESGLAGAPKRQES